MGRKQEFYLKCIKCKAEREIVFSSGESKIWGCRKCEKLHMTNCWGDLEGDGLFCSTTELKAHHFPNWMDIYNNGVDRFYLINAVNLLGKLATRPEKRMPKKNRGKA